MLLACKTQFFNRLLEVVILLFINKILAMFKMYVKYAKILYMKELSGRAINTFTNCAVLTDGACR